jgi:hypothetical protein
MTSVFSKMQLFGYLRPAMIAAGDRTRIRNTVQEKKLSKKMPEHT